MRPRLNLVTTCICLLAVRSWHACTLHKLGSSSWPQGQRSILLLPLALHITHAAASTATEDVIPVDASRVRLSSFVDTTVSLTHELDAGGFEAATQVVDINANESADALCVLQGNVDETANCTYEAVDRLNQRGLHPILTQLVKTAFFRYFKVNIHCDCPLWPDEAMCESSGCSVCECEPTEVPQTWLSEEMCAIGTEEVAATEQLCSTPQCMADADSLVDSRVEPGVSKALRSLKGWRGLNNPWMASGEDDEQYMYINLLVNPERYTGYKGPHAHKIWDAIYSQSCFNVPDCTEKRVFYRLISGVHASISAHISGIYLLSEEVAAATPHPFLRSPLSGVSKAVWGPSLKQFEARLGNPAVRDRVENLYFAYLFVLRAVMKVAPLIESYDYNTGLPVDDAETKRLARELANRPDLHEVCPLPFDEGRLWKGEEGPALREQLQKSFQNITRIMDCVGCEKCKLWGKLQTLGIASALKILFSSADCGEGPLSSGQLVELERNELIALVNLLTRLSNSLEIYRTMSRQLAEKTGASRSLPVYESVA